MNVVICIYSSKMRCGKSFGYVEKWKDIVIFFENSKMICASEDLTVGNFCLLVNPAGSLIEGEYKIEYLGVEIDFSGAFACEALL